MAGAYEAIQVTVGPDGFFPASFRWEGRACRVLAVQRVRTCGAERRYRVSTSEGGVELALHLGNGVWRLTDRPNRLTRAWHRWENGARYPLPAWRRRATA